MLLTVMPVSILDIKPLLHHLLLHLPVLLLMLLVTLPIHLLLQMPPVLMLVLMPVLHHQAHPLQAHHLQAHLHHLLKFKLVLTAQPIVLPTVHLLPPVTITVLQDIVGNHLVINVSNQDQSN